MNTNHTSGRLAKGMFLVQRPDGVWLDQVHTTAQRAANAAEFLDMVPAPKLPDLDDIDWSRF